MNRILALLRDKHEEIYKVFLFIATIAAIVYLFPKEGKFKYEFVKGKPWLHKELIAPFDFAIQKSPEELLQEEKEIRANTLPYFKVDTSALLSQIDYFSKEFAITWNKKYEDPLNKNGLKNKQALIEIKQNTYKTGIDILRNVYKKGIIQISDVIEGKSPDDLIMVINNNVAEEKPLKDFFTLQSAYNFIQSEITKYKFIDKELLAPLLSNSISHNITYDEVTNAKVLEEQLNNISLTRGKIQKGERIISKGDLIDDKKFEILESLKAEYTSKTGGFYNYLFILAGQVLLVSLCLMILFFFLYLFRKDIIANNLKVSFILLITVLMVLMATISLKFEFISIYALPFGILPIIIRAFYDTRLALFTHLVNCLIIGFVAPNGFEFIFIQVLTGIFAVFSIVNMSRRSQLFFTALIIFMTYSFSYSGLAIIEEGSWKSIEPKYFAWFASSSLLTLFAYPLIYLFEKLFGFISDVTLMELSDPNSPLLRELAMRAPGTFQHSLQVANIAEEAIFEIGGDTLLVRTGALYHDIGKMNMPLYFIENQTTGINPHDELSFDESAEIIISHVIKGVERAKKYNLPEPIIDFIRTHHGDSMVQYFYRSYLKQFPDKLVDEKKFRYPGPRPYSKETAVLMMADSVEAASRSLKSYDSDSIDKLVENIISHQIDQNQFINADITFKDITVVKKIFKKKLLNMYHVRIEYPK